MDANLMSGVIKVNQWTSNQQGRPSTHGWKGDTNLSLNSSTVILNSTAIQPNAIYQSEADFAMDNFTENAQHHHKTLK